jgi:superfamily II DNA or RNA helicase
LQDVHDKLESVLKGTVDEQKLVQIENSFIKYGENYISGIHIASLDAARLYVEKEDKGRLSTRLVNPEILIIDECHHCGSQEDLSDLKRMDSDANQTYKAVYQLITGNYWLNSDPPKLVVFMSATPFRSREQFVNLLRLLTHKSAVENAYSPEITEIELQERLAAEDSSAGVIWRQQDDVHSWSGEGLFPKLNIERIYLNTSREYLNLIKEIRETVQRICRNNNDKFGGFATRKLEIRLTSSSIAGACYLFRWCIRHQKPWDNKDKAYKQDTSNSTENLRKLIKEISRQLGAYAAKNYEDVSFPSDDFSFTAGSIRDAKSSIPEIYDFNKKLWQKDDEGKNFIATSDEIIELTNLGLSLLNLTAASEGIRVENAKLNWLREMLRQYPEERFLVFTESLQTCEIITKALSRESDKLTGNMGDSARGEVVRRFRGVSNNPPIQVLVATSAADEGFDFQVANKVVHWDLSSSPATLMQRNGRVARLGQVSDVTAYYLIMTGTHEEKREKALVEKFNQIGIKDERLWLKILGSISEGDIISAVEDNRINKILEDAQKQNEEMDRRLREIQENNIKEQSVIDRNMLAKRLDRWLKLGLPYYDQGEFRLSFDTVKWQRPVFGEVTTMEPAEAKVATIYRESQSKTVTFDPEFKLFGRDGDSYSLAGLRPWNKIKKRNVVKHRPIQGADLIGELACSLARQRQADFTTISAASLATSPQESLQSLKDTRYLLFATHPLRELEEKSSSEEKTYRYLTFYAFGEDLSNPLNPQGAKAEDVYELIDLLEKEALKRKSVPLEASVLTEAEHAGRSMAEWLQTSRKLPRRGQQTYFLPLPVALVAVRRDTNSDGSTLSQATSQENSNPGQSGESLLSKPGADIDSELANRFYALASIWQSEVEGMSSTVQMSNHPAYQEIISMGTQVVPLLLQELKENPLYWLQALNAITGANPIKPEQRGRVKKMAEAWLEWGKNQGYLVGENVSTT